MSGGWRADVKHRPDGALVSGPAEKQRGGADCTEEQCGKD
jgi:hypothetical protein